MFGRNSNSIHRFWKISRNTVSIIWSYRNNSNNNNTTIKPSGPSGVTGEPSTVITEKDLIITYIGNYSAINNVLPNDMENATPLPDRYFTIENTSNRSLTYRLVWKISKNEFKI